MDTYHRSTYFYNSILIRDTNRILIIDEEVRRRLFRPNLRSKDRLISNKVTPRLAALFQIIPKRSKLEVEVRKLLDKL